MVEIRDTDDMIKCFWALCADPSPEFFPRRRNVPAHQNMACRNGFIAAAVFYRKVGVRDTSRVPLGRVEEAEITRRREDPSLSTASVYLVHGRWYPGM